MRNNMTYVSNPEALWFGLLAPITYIVIPMHAGAVFSLTFCLLRGGQASGKLNTNSHTHAHKSSVIGRFCLTWTLFFLFSFDSCDRRCGNGAFTPRSLYSTPHRRTAAASACCSGCSCWCRECWGLGRPAGAGGGCGVWASGWGGNWQREREWWQPVVWIPWAKNLPLQPKQRGRRKQAEERRDERICTVLMVRFVLNSSNFDLPRPLIGGLGEELQNTEVYAHSSVFQFSPIFYLINWWAACAR